jgi:Uma2 family endonuclease
MQTATKVGPADHGQGMTLEEFEAADYQEGYKYELIDGRLYVTYEPDPPEDIIEKWLLVELTLYSRQHPRVINYVTDKARIFIPADPPVTVPEPDLAAFRRFPLRLPPDQLRWQDVSPVLVGEVLSPNDPHKDLIRNVQLYLLVPTIKEYWVLDARAPADGPFLRVYRRRGKRWQTIDLAYGDTYTTPLLPDFRLVLEPRT